MPPKPKFSKEEIVEAALQITSENGVEALTANSLREKLNCSASPIFTVFDSMKEIQNQVKLAAMHRFETFSANFSELPHFKQIGMKMVQFATQEPKLYQLLFMQENSQTVAFDDLFVKLGSTAKESILALENDYSLTESQAKHVFRTVWIYTFGIGALCATKACSFSTEELSAMLTAQFSAVLAFEKSKNNDN